MASKSLKRDIPFHPGAPPRIVLMTDFGDRDGYVGAMRGVLASDAPGAAVYDLTHGIAPHDVRAGAFVLASAARWYPRGTIFVAVVDPGVGSSRRGLVLVSGGRAYVGPDNGLFDLATEGDPVRAYALDTARVTDRPIASTFHGRDLFAPAAARLACATPPEELGEAVDDTVALDLPAAVEDGARGLRLAVLHVDRFGNVVTNLSEKSPLAALCGKGRPSHLLPPGRSDGPPIEIRDSYAGAAEGTPFLIWGSSGFLEISIDRASASEALGIRSGDAIELRRARSSPTAHRD